MADSGYYMEMSYGEVKKALRSRKYVLIDIRSEYEYGKGHLPGAISIPEHELPYRIKEMDINKRYIFVCEQGVKSKAIAKIFANKGFVAINLIDGMEGLYC